MRRFLLSTLLLASPVAAVGAPQEVGEALSDEARAYLDKALDAMQEQSLVRKSIDWPTFRADVLARAGRAQTTRDTWAALDHAVECLGDGHSFLATPGRSNEWVEKARDSFTDPEGRWLDEGFGYVKVPGYLGIDPAEDRPFALALQLIIAELDGRGPAGWVVDLRRDTGGNMWPMLAGIGPILGDGHVGSFVGAEGRASRWFYRAGRAGVGENAFIDLSEEAHSLRKPWPAVAVLTSEETASSGEAIAVAFRGRPRTRSFGSGTAGVSTANDTIWLGDGAMLFLCVAKDADRTGRVYGDVIEPDETIEGDPTGEADVVLASAVAWLKEATSAPEVEVFGPGVISIGGRSENAASFTPDGRTVLFSRTEGWASQVPLLSTFVDGRWTEPVPAGFADAVYNAAFSQDGSRVVFLEPRSGADDNHAMLVERTGAGWGQPRDLTAEFGIRGGYFCLLADGTLYFESDGDLYRAEWSEGAYAEPARLDATINTGATEFSQYVDPEERLIVFTRAVEGDDEASGLYLSTRTSAGWSPARRLDLPYGWSPVLSPDRRELIYTSDCVSPDLDIVRVPAPPELLR